MKNRLVSFIRIIRTFFERAARSRKVVFFISGTLSMLCVSGTAFAAPVYDTSTTGYGVNPSVSITRGTSASNYIGLAAIVCVAGGTVSNVTWGGTAMTQLMDVAGSSGTGHDYWYYLVNPASGARRGEQHRRL
jgi:hypothetical protein